ncbi:hypothetical protein [Yersinia phage fHe-Yen9-04]|uniref:Uncharacterized protein n=2 Tax=Eneladusvirus Yen904 TaxID=2560849 RepID=A0A2C9CXN4_9CAUD|nr:hypothetical protein FDJ41_gp396 [Yersinia phage fHe-Yen9-04]SOK58784.1 hypothetical protein [Yersinia phage fHe-Yen9-04]SOK59322.1 hypothetical protein [Yersinia phage fHe-Yen9-03]VUE36553.1 hypothetical protein [Yersinia phage fHe-Yen9-04]
MIIEIESVCDVEKIIKNSHSYTVKNEDITKEVFIEFFEKCSPSEYERLYYLNVLKYYDEVLDDNIAKVLLSGKYALSWLLNEAKLSPTMITYIVDNLEVPLDTIIAKQPITFDQIIKLLSNKSFHLNSGDLGEAIGSTGNIEMAKQFITEWDNILPLMNKSLRNVDLSEFRYHMFNNFGDIIIDPVDELTLFGVNRPSISTEELRTYEPCSDGWKRVLKWAPRNDTQYSWNTFVAFHTIANKDELHNVQSDLIWLASTYLETHNLIK